MNLRLARFGNAQPKAAAHGGSRARRGSSGEAREQGEARERDDDNDFGDRFSPQITRTEEDLTTT